MKAYVSLIVVAFGSNTQLKPVELTACEKCESHIEIPFVRYLSDFTEEAEARKLTLAKTPLVIKFNEDRDRDTIGICMVSVNKQARRYVFIDKTYWNKVDTFARKALVFHELAHCLLNVETHADSGIMSEFVPVDTKNLFEDFWVYVAKNSRN